MATTARKIRVGILVTITVVLLIFSLENRGPVALSLLGFEFFWPKVMLIGFCLLLGFVAGYIGRTLVSRRSRKHRAGDTAGISGDAV